MTSLSKLERFPRTSKIPTQSPKYWAKEKDRYLRQLLIADIEELTGRPLFVYFSQLDQEINHTDPDDIAEIISATDSDEADIFIQTPGGLVDACEKIVNVLRKKFRQYRVVVPSWAKSAGTVIALSSNEIVLGINSELGPIDPQWNIGGNPVPCELIAKDSAFPEHIRQMAQLASDRMEKMATDLLQNGMMSGKTADEISLAIAKLSKSSGYMSHGAVIDSNEANDLGLNVKYLSPDDAIWSRVWLLYCMYDYDCKAKQLGKIFEGVKYSIGRPI